MIPQIISPFRSAALLRLGAAMVSSLFLMALPVWAQPGGSWFSDDIGSVGFHGDASESGGVVTVRGAGADIWGRADGFHYRYQTLSGDGMIRARVTNTGSGNAWAKVGVMVREDPTAGARNLMALLTPAGSLGLQIRSAAGGDTTYTEHTRAGAPVWLAIVREGNNFSALRSTDGAHWTAGPTVTLALPTTIYVGLAVTSHNTRVLQTATFDNVSVSSGVTSGAPIAPASLQVHSPFAGGLQLNWTDRSNNETGFQIERATGSGPFVALTTAPVNTTAYVDNHLPERGTYSYRVRAVRDSAYSAFIGPVSARVEEAPLDASWTGVDVGNTGSAGSDAGIPPTVTMNAGGSDIHGTADSFRFHFANFRGDVSIIARVASMTNTNAWAKAGVVFRTSLAPGAANAAMLLTPTSGGTFQTRIFANATTSHQGVAGLAAPYWVRLTRAGNNFTGYVSVNGNDWTLVGTQYIEMPEMAYVGLGASSHASAQIIVSFEHVTTATPPPPPGAMVLRNLGTGTGSVTDSSNITIQATSGDIYGTADSGVLYSRTWTGKGVFTTRVDQLTRTHDWAKAGIMFRAGPMAGAANVFIALTPTQGAILQSRSAEGGSTVMHGQARSVGLGNWLRIYREAGTIRAYWSTDASTWFLIGSAPDPLPDTIWVGLAVSSHNPSAATTAIFTGSGDI